MMMRMMINNLRSSSHFATVHGLETVKAPCGVQRAQYEQTTIKKPCNAYTLFMQDFMKKRAPTDRASAQASMSDGMMTSLLLIRAAS